MGHHVSSSVSDSDFDSEEVEPEYESVIGLLRKYSKEEPSAIPSHHVSFSVGTVYCSYTTLIQHIYFSILLLCAIHFLGDLRVW